MLICCGQNHYYAMNVYGWHFILKPLCLSSLIALWFSSYISLIFDYLLVNESFKPKNHNKQFPFSFSCFEIVLACSLCSLGTISSTNIFGIISRDGSEVYLPWDIIIDLVLRSEQNQKIFQTTFSPSSGSQWLPEKLGQEGDLPHLCIWVSQIQNFFWKKLDKFENLSLLLLCLLLIS